ncbi:MAG: response regulator transcription factor [Christensenella sp.]|nr:response regulator transcription factor [Christensenella sp.]
MKSRILLADDHKLFTDSLQFLLGTYGIEVVGVAVNGLEAVQKAESLSPDIILMDVRMPVCDGIGALKIIKNRMPGIKVVMLTTSEEDEDLFQSIKQGASGYLLKSMNGNELVDMLINLENGGAPLSPKLAARLLKEISSDETSNQKRDTEPPVRTETSLTGRQMEVLESVASGSTYKETGDRLGITERTVKYHMGSMMEQLQMENKSQVIAYVVKMGWFKDRK